MKIYDIPKELDNQVKELLSVSLSELLEDRNFMLEDIYALYKQCHPKKNFFFLLKEKMNKRMKLILGKEIN